MSDTQQMSYAKQVVAMKTGRQIPDLLRELYVDNGWSQQSVADYLGVTRLTVRAWLLEYGIKREDVA